LFHDLLLFFVVINLLFSRDTKILISSSDRFKFLCCLYASEQAVFTKMCVENYSFPLKFGDPPFFPPNNNERSKERKKGQTKFSFFFLSEQMSEARSNSISFHQYFTKRWIEENDVACDPIETVFYEGSLTSLEKTISKKITRENLEIMNMLLTLLTCSPVILKFFRIWTI
jgi:hypothetical protein